MRPLVTYDDLVEIGDAYREAGDASQENDEDRKYPPHVVERFENVGIDYDGYRSFVEYEVGIGAERYGMLGMVALPAMMTSFAVGFILGSEATQLAQSRAQEQLRAGLDELPEVS